MNVGLAAIGIGNGARAGVLRETARSAEAAGFSRLWMGEHVVLFDRHDSRYPYSASGDFPLDAKIDWLDPFIALTFAAAATRTIRLATGICLLPEHNPVVLAKEIASLDRLSGGRFSLGIGIGWMAEEFAAVGVPFERRAQRTREYVSVMRRLWSEDAVTVDGEFVNLRAACSFPKPQRGRVPVIVGGESRPALSRAAEYCDGWHGFNLGPDEAAEKIAVLRELLAARGRDRDAFEVIVAPFTKPVEPADLERYRALGVTEVVIVASPPAEEDRVADWVSSLARKWIERA
jgi:probable F420-dependent oxidoreductase